MPISSRGCGLEIARCTLLPATPPCSLHLRRGRDDGSLTVGRVGGRQLGGGAMLLVLENSTHDSYNDVLALFSTRLGWFLRRVWLLSWRVEVQGYIEVTIAKELRHPQPLHDSILAERYSLQPGFCRFCMPAP